MLWSWFVLVNMWTVVILGVMMIRDQQYPHGAAFAAVLLSIVLGTISTLLVWLAVVEVVARMIASIFGALPL